MWDQGQISLSRALVIGTKLPTKEKIMQGQQKVPLTPLVTKNVARVGGEENQETTESLLLHAATQHKPSIWGSFHHTKIRVGHIFEDCAIFNHVTETYKQEP